jgi:hypothetical protein
VENQLYLCNSKLPEPVAAFPDFKSATRWSEEIARKTKYVRGGNWMLILNYWTKPQLLASVGVKKD